MARKNADSALSSSNNSLYTSPALLSGVAGCPALPRANSVPIACLKTLSASCGSPLIESKMPSILSVRPGSAPVSTPARATAIASLSRPSFISIQAREPGYQLAMYPRDSNVSSDCKAPL